MTAGCTLKFLSPELAAYAAALQAYPQCNLLLIGEGALADAIAATGPAESAAIQRLPEIPGAILPGTVLILTEIDEERLSAQLLACVDCTDLTILAPLTARHFSRKPLFIVSIPKGGTHLVYELAKALGYAAGVELPDFPQPQTWYCVEYSNSHTVARDFFVDSVRRAPFGNRHHPFPHSPVLFGYRHPLDILVSEANYYCRDGKTVYSGYFDGEDIDQRIHRLIHDEWLLGTLTQRVGGFLPWLRFPNVIPVSFEELVGEQGGSSEVLQHRLIWSLLLKLQADGNVADVAARVFNTHSATFHEGRIGAYRKQLSASLIGELAQNCHALLAGFGYDTESDPPISRHTEAYIRRPLQYSAQDFAKMALGVESGFMGCNLVRYAGRFYAMPLTAGPIDFASLSADQLGSLPSAGSLSELKTLLGIGADHYHMQRRQLDQAGLSLLSEIAPPADAYWHMPSISPCILAEYRGFNLILWQGRHLAIRQSVGAVDLSQNFATLRAEYSSSDLVIAVDTETLRQQIDGVLEAKRLASDLGDMRAVVGGLEAAVQRQQIDGVLEAKRLASDLGDIRALVGGLESAVQKLEQDCVVISNKQAGIQYRTEVAISVQAEEESRARVALASQLRQQMQGLQARIDALEGNRVIIMVNRLTHIYRRIMKR